MADYRIYCLDGTGRIDLADWIAADDDEAAITHARKFHPDASLCEVWHKSRLVAKINSEGQAERF